MKFTLVVLLFISAVSAAPTPAPHANKSLVETLEARASALLTYIKKVIAENKADHGHLLAAIEHQSAQLEKLVADLKAQLADTHKEHQLHNIHVAEEKLLGLENRILEEIIALEHAKNPDVPPKGQTVDQLIAFAENLVKKGKEAISKHPRAQEVGDVERELIILEALIRALHQKPNVQPAELKKEAAELARQEKSLQQLIEKINARKP